MTVPPLPPADPAAPAPGPSDTAVLTVTCPDRGGIVAAVSQFLFNHGANIIHSDQHSSGLAGGTFFMRMEFSLVGLDLALEPLRRAFQNVVADPFGMEWRLDDAARPGRMALMVSRYDHCLLDLLWRVRRGDLNAEVPLVLSNHEDLRSDAETFGVPFHVVPVTRENKPEAEAEQVRLLREAGADFVVLARYMQILSSPFLEAVGVPVINIHHSFLPAFVGAEPYRKAKERGVKIIGATAHYVTEDLDEGPIIEQDVVRVSHRDTAQDFARRGADVERQVLARAVLWHCQDRVVRHARQTIVF